MKALHKQFIDCNRLNSALCSLILGQLLSFITYAEPFFLTQWHLRVYISFKVKSQSNSNKAFFSPYVTSLKGLMFCSALNETALSVSLPSNRIPFHCHHEWSVGVNTSYWYVFHGILAFIPYRKSILEESVPRCCPAGTGTMPNISLTGKFPKGRMYSTECPYGLPAVPFSLPHHDQRWALLWDSDYLQNLLT